MTQATPKLSKAALRRFPGGLVRYQHQFNPSVIYTPGVQYVANEGQAYWLIDTIAAWIGSSEFEKARHLDTRISSLHFWSLEVKPDRSATLTAKADSPDEPFIVQELDYTDFPLDQIDIWVGSSGKHWTLYLPSEH